MEGRRRRKRKVGYKRTLAFLGSIRIMGIDMSFLYPLELQLIPQGWQVSETLYSAPKQPILVTGEGDAKNGRYVVIAVEVVAVAGSTSESMTRA